MPTIYPDVVDSRFGVQTKAGSARRIVYVRDGLKSAFGWSLADHLEERRQR
jgi:hypothetical protein